MAANPKMPPLPTRPKRGPTKPAPGKKYVPHAPFKKRPAK